ncbi:MAG: formylglycine-generating enzyme family protein [Candidatus Poribacteria bacterium]|nr:formylglycine-generating enzyme family protein [Candidatus Poribacteria bacterium]
MNNRISGSVLVMVGVLCVFMIGFKPDALESVADEIAEVVVPEGMALIPAGEFEMGSDDVEGDDIEQPVHIVYVDAFYMDTHEVTNAQYKKFIDANPQWQKGRWWQRDRIKRKFHNGNYLKDWDGNDYPDGKGDHPVKVSWYAAMAYAKWVGKRLPTEAEWEKAARGGLVGKKYPWGDSIDADKANYGGIVGDTTPVGTYPANGYGLYDMTGNAFEWCLDEYDPNFYAGSPHWNPLSSANTVGWLNDNFTKVKTSRVVRDGCNGCVPHAVRVADRGERDPRGSFGFRCVRDTNP